MEHIQYLARVVPRMCLDASHEHYCAHSHEYAFDYLCDTSLREYENTILLSPADDDTSVLGVMYVHGKHLRDRYPMIDTSLKHLFSFDPIRPMATYAVVFVKLVEEVEEGEIF